MHTPQEHVQFAEQHFTEAASMHKTMRLRWCAVAYFYTANHLIKAALPTMINIPPDKQYPTEHTGQFGTTTIVKRYLPELANAYESLYSAGLAVRYHGADISTGEAENFRFRDLPTIAAWTCLQLHEAPCACWLNTV